MFVTDFDVFLMYGYGFLEKKKKLPIRKQHGCC